MKKLTVQNKMTKEQEAIIALKIGALTYLLNTVVRYMEDNAHLQPIYKQKVKYFAKELKKEVEQRTKTLFKYFDHVEVTAEDQNMFLTSYEDFYEIIEYAFASPENFNEFINHNTIVENEPETSDSTSGS